MLPNSASSDPPEVSSDIAWHVSYEFQAMRAAYLILPGDGWNPEGLVLESFWVHARNILDFFFPRGNPRPDDICAKQYADDWDDGVARTSELVIADDSLIQWRRRLDKQVSHLTRQRCQEPDPEWDWRRLGIALELLLDEFLGLLSKPRAEWFAIPPPGWSDHRAMAWANHQIPRMGRGS